MSEIFLCVVTFHRSALVCVVMYNSLIHNFVTKKRLDYAKYI